MRHYQPDICGQHGPSRRRFLHQVASAAGAGLLAAHADAQTISSGGKPRNSARACVFIDLQGAPSHLDTFDPKDGPWNPQDADLRQHPGGIVLSRTFFPELSKHTQDLCVLQSVQSWEAAHERGQFYAQTFHPFNPAFAPEIPHIGAVVARERGAAGGPMPPFLSFNANGMQGSVFLGGKAAPFSPYTNPDGLGTLEHNFFGSESQRRFDERFNLLQELDAPLRRNPYDEKMAAMADFYFAAKGMMYDQRIANVFRFSRDDDGRYGGTGFARGLIVARNAIRAKNGASFINVRLAGWDTHQNMFDRSYAPNMYTLNGELDRALGSFIADLKASGDLAQTLIVVMGEFGRTPGPLNGRGGRDHHKNAMSVAMLGGGVRGGRVIGAKDSLGDQIVEPGWKAARPIYPEDIGCTILSALGIDWTRKILDTPSGRRYEYVNGASEGGHFPVDEVFG
jgi:hypothetical protein